MDCEAIKVYADIIYKKNTDLNLLLELLED